MLRKLSVARSTKMPDDKNNETWGEYASPPCFLHELGPSYAGLISLPAGVAAGPGRALAED
jgi:hypothetical protein